MLQEKRKKVDLMTFTRETITFVLKKNLEIVKIGGYILFTYESENLVHTSKTWPSADTLFMCQLVKTWGTITFFQYSFISSLKKAIGHFISVVFFG